MQSNKELRKYFFCSLFFFAMTGETGDLHGLTRLEFNIQKGFVAFCVFVFFVSNTRCEDLKALASGSNKGPGGHVIHTERTELFLNHGRVIVFDTVVSDLR